MKKLNDFHQDLYLLIEKLVKTDAKSITIKTKEATIVFELRNGDLTGPSRRRQDHFVRLNQLPVPH